MTVFPAKDGFDGGAFAGAMFIGFTYVMMPLGMGLELIEDREIRAKNQLRVNGLTFGLYFGSFFFVLGGMMLIAFGVLLALVQAFSIDALVVGPAFATLAILYVMYTPCSLVFCATISYMFDKVEDGQFLFPVGSYMGFIPYIAISILDMLQVADGEVAKYLHVAFCFLSPMYIPFGIIYYINREYAFSLCTVDGTCDQLTMGDYWGNFEIWTIAIACVFNTVVWYYGLKVVDILKDGGSAKDTFRSVQYNEWKRSYSECSHKETLWQKLL